MTNILFGLAINCLNSLNSIYSELFSLVYKTQRTKFLRIYSQYSNTTSRCFLSRVVLWQIILENNTYYTLILNIDLGGLNFILSVTQLETGFFLNISLSPPFSWRIFFRKFTDVSSFFAPWRYKSSLHLLPLLLPRNIFLMVWEPLLWNVIMRKRGSPSLSLCGG